MPTIITHPANVELLKEKLNIGEYDDRRRWAWESFTIKTNTNMERDKPTGKIILPDGSVVDRDRVLLDTPFVTYGPEDIRHLLYVGLISEEREPVFYVVNESAFRFDAMSSMWQEPRRSVVIRTA